MPSGDAHRGPEGDGGGEDENNDEPTQQVITRPGRFQASGCAWVFRHDARKYTDFPLSRQYPP